MMIAPVRLQSGRNRFKQIDCLDNATKLAFRLHFKRFT
jgi:hypothetical protein